MSLYYQDATVTVHAGDCLDVLRELPDASVDSVVTDPPYGLSFMSKKWDDFSAEGRGSKVRTRRAAEVTPTGKGHSTSGGPYLATGVDDTRTGGHPFQAWCESWAVECLRVLKPGGHLLAFGGTRTYHRLTCAIEDAGFEIRDSIAWLYGSGFPKSLDVSKAIDRAAGAARTSLGVAKGAAPSRTESLGVFASECAATAPATADARTWQGWGTALKPAFEPVVVARKPLSGTVAATVLAHGTGALNIDVCRVSAGQDYADKCASVVGLKSNRNGDAYGEWSGTRTDSTSPAGRWPANVLLDGGTAANLDAEVGESVSRVGQPRGALNGDGWGMTATGAEYADDAGGPSRYFPTFRYTAKAATDERVRVNGTAHPTVKPLDLMRWLVRLVTPPGGTVLEPFAGSGTTVEACILEGLKCVAIEREPDYLPLIVQRLDRRHRPIDALRGADPDADLGLFGDFA